MPLTQLSFMAKYNHKDSFTFLTQSEFFVAPIYSAANHKTVTSRWRLLCKSV